MAIITICGRLGSGAHEIGKLVAEKMHIDFLDRKIVAEVASRLNLQEQEVVYKEMPPTGLKARIAEALVRGYSIGDGTQMVYIPMSQIPLDDNNYLKALTSFVKDIARSHSVVIFGRGSQFILQDCPSALHILVVAPYRTRLNRVMTERGLGEEQARQEINRFDNSAREYIKRFFGAEMDDHMTYDLLVNTERLTYEAAADVIVKTSRLKITEPAMQG